MQPILFTYTHKYGKYPNYQVLATNRNLANGMLTIWTSYLDNYDGRNCDFEVTEKSMNLYTEQDSDAIYKAVKEIRGF